MDNLIGRQPYNGMVGGEFLAGKNKKQDVEAKTPEATFEVKKNVENSEAIQGELDAQANINRALLNVPQFISLNKVNDFSKMNDEELIKFATEKLGSKRVNEIEQAVIGGFENGVNDVVNQIKSDPELAGFEMTNAQIYAAAARAIAG